MISSLSSASITKVIQPFIWAYFLIGGSNGSSPETRYISDEWGNTRWGFDELFNTWIPKAIEQGANGIYLQNPGGLDSILPPNLMEADQFLRAAENKELGAGWVQSFKDAVANFRAKYPNVPILFYNGSISNIDRITKKTGGEWLNYVKSCYNVYLDQPNNHEMYIGFDASCFDTENSREEAFRNLMQKTGFKCVVEGYWPQSNAYLTKYPCIVTESLWQHPWYTRAYVPGKRCLRCLDQDPPVEGRKAALCKWMNKVFLDKHEIVIGSHLWLKQGWNIRDVFAGI